MSQVSVTLDAFQADSQCDACGRGGKECVTVKSGLGEALDGGEFCFKCLGRLMAKLQAARERNGESGNHLGEADSRGEA